MTILSQVLHSRILKNASWLIAGKIFQMLLGILVSLITARYLGPSNYGLINYGAAYTAFASSICSLGINSILVKEFIEKRDTEGTVIGSALFLKMVASTFSILTILSVSYVVDKEDSLARYIVFLCSLGLIFQIFDTFNYWFQSRLQSKVSALVSFFAYAATTIYKIVLLVLEKDVRYFAFASSIDYILLAILLLIYYYKYGGRKINLSFGCAKRLLSKGHHFILPSLMVAVYGQTDKVMLKQFISDAEIGYYSTAMTVCTMWCFVLSAIIDSFYPTIMESYKAGGKDFNYKNKLLYAIIFYASFSVSLILAIFAEPIILLLYGKQYLPAAMPMRIVTWYTAFSYLGVARNAWLVCKDRQKCLKYVYFSAAFINVLLNILLIPQWGASGAALASLLSQIMTVLIVPFFVSDLRENSIMMIKSIFFKLKD